MANGTHSVTAVARDAAGNTTTSAPVSVTVSNAAPDTAAPTVALTAPAANATVSGTVTVSAGGGRQRRRGRRAVPGGWRAWASRTGGALSGSSWSHGQSGNGIHTLRAVARDAATNTTTSAPGVAVTVSNTAADGSGGGVRVR